MFRLGADRPQGVTQLEPGGRIARRRGSNRNHRSSRALLRRRSARFRRTSPEQGARRAMITVRPATPSDAAAWLELRHALWPVGSQAEHREAIDRFFAGDAQEPLAVLLAEDERTASGSCASPAKN